MAEHQRAGLSGTDSRRDLPSQDLFNVPLRWCPPALVCPGLPKLAPSSASAARVLSQQKVDDGAPRHVWETAIIPSIHPRTRAPATFAIASPSPGCEHVPIRPTVVALPACSACWQCGRFSRPPPSGARPDGPASGGVRLGRPKAYPRCVAARQPPQTREIVPRSPCMHSISLLFSPVSGTQVHVRALDGASMAAA